MRPNRPTRRSGSFSFSRLFGAGRSRLSKAPRRRDVERLEERQLLTATPNTNEFFADQWYLLATGQNTEFNQQSPTFNQTLAVEGQDLNVVGAWAQGVDGTGVQVAILAGGFDLTHEDLVFTTAPLIDNADQLTGDTDPSADDLTDFLGTALAGIVAADDNSVGIVGVAHGADLFPVRIDPGPNELGAPTIDAINRALRTNAGFVQDLNGDGVPDAPTGTTLVPIDIDNDGVSDGFGLDPSTVTDVFLHSGAFIEDAAGASPRSAVTLAIGPSIEDPTAEVSLLDAIIDTAIGGRAVWLDDVAQGGDGDGLLDQDEIHALGSIHVVPSGNNAGSGNVTNPFIPVGDWSSSQYNQLANSIYTITVGAVDYDGRYRDPATGTVTGYAEAGANVLVVAPSGSGSRDSASLQVINNGVVTTDPTGVNGANQPGLPNFEFDDDYFADVDYASGPIGTEAAAAQVAGVIALMLDANPNLTKRDVEQILIQSARTNDQFDESWIVNQVQEFRDVYGSSIPNYQYSNIDLDGDGAADLENVIIPNDGLDANGNFLVTRGIFQTDNGFDLGLPWFYDRTLVPDDMGMLAPRGTGGLVDVTDANTGSAEEPAMPMVLSPAQRQTEVILYSPGFSAGQGAQFLVTPLNNVTSAPGLDARTPLEFENGAGFTVSHGYGRFLEEMGYAHGVVDAEVAVELAQAWETNDLYLDEQIAITSERIGGSQPIRIQPRAFATDANGNRRLYIPGGVSDVDINTELYEAYLGGVTYEDVTDANDAVIGRVITDAPFFDPEGDLDIADPDRGTTRIPIRFDASVTDFASIEWLEFTTEVNSGDVDNLRLALVSPDGTQSELNLYRPQINAGLGPAQQPQGQQGKFRPFFEAIDDSVGGILLNDDVITGTEANNTGSVDSPDALDANEAWTWTTNRHWGELFSFQANTLTEDPPGGSAGFINDDQWYIIVENHGDGAVTLGGNYEVTAYGTEATGTRIQGKIGVDDNAQGVTGIDNDSNFNFNRYVEFAEIVVDIDTGAFFVDGQGNPILDAQGQPIPVLERVSQTVIVDDANDSVTYTNANDPDFDNIYKAFDPDTGVEVFYPVVDRDAYFTLDGATLATSMDNFFKVRRGQNVSVVGVVDYITAEQSGRGSAEFLDPNAQALDPTAPDSLPPGVSAADPLLGIVPLTFRNFDYAQESFEHGVTVTATPTRHLWQINSTSGVLEMIPGSSTTVTDQVQRFTTGHDGNYYFDVLSTPAPPDPSQFVSMDQYDVVAAEWLRLFGETYTYDISIDSASTARAKAADTAHGGFFDVPSPFENDSTIQFNYVSSVVNGSNVASVANYTVDIFSQGQFQLEAGTIATFDDFGATSKVTNLNFLLEVDPALTNVEVSGTVYRDRDGNGVQDPNVEESQAGVTVFYDANQSGSLDQGDVSAVTDANGNYAFTVPGLTSAQTIQIEVDQTTIDPTLELLNPLTGAQSINVTPGTPTAGVDFTLRLIGGEPAQVTGTVFEDVNQNGVQDGVESGVGSSKQVRVYIDSTPNGVYDVGEPTAFTQSNGTYVIESSLTGSFTVRIDPGAFTQTLPANDAGVDITLVQGQTVSAVDFGVFDGRNQDFGDLFAYPTLLSEDGPRHVVLPNVRLGSLVDVDSDGFGDPLLTTSPDSFGDDFDASDDEDGVTLVGTISEGSTFDFDVEAYGDGFVLNAWIDFDNDGVFESSEQIYTNLEDIQADSANPAPIPSVTAPTGAAFDSTATFFAARFRWGPAGLGPTGAANAGEVEDYLLATTPPIAVTGQVRIDADGDSAFDGFGSASPDTAVAGATVYFDQNLNGMLDPTERRGVTDANGFYEILIDSTQSIDVTIRVDETSLDPTLESLIPVDGVFSQTVSASDPVTANFLYGFPQGVSGTVFSDANNNGVNDGDVGFGGLTVNVFGDPDLDGTFDTLIGSAVTAADGSYTVPVPVIGSYDVAVDLSSLEFVTQTSPAGGAAQRVTVGIGAITSGIDFGAFDAVPTFTQDFGDLITDGTRNYPTTAADDGARHTIVPGVFLGDVPPDADPGTRESADAQADDLLFGDDEDAINVLTPSITPNGELSFEAKVNGTGAVLNAWVDFNNDGDWDDAGEQILTDRGATSGIITTFIVNTPADVDITAQAYAARFRWGESGLSYTGAAAAGEVEDYLIARVQTVGGVDGDYNGDNLVTTSDYDTWVATFGDSVPAGTGADGNGNGVIDAGDYSIWRDAHSAAGSPAFALATSSSEVVDLTDEPLSPARVQQLPTKTRALATAAFDADAFSPMMLPDAAAAGAVDESLAVIEEESVAEDALAAALLEWSLDQPIGEASEDGSSLDGYADEETEEEAAATVGEALVL